MKPTTTRTRAIVFPFDQFGSGGTAAGAELLGDALEEVLDDNDEETRPIRAHCYRDLVDIHRVEFDTIDQLAAWRAIGEEEIRKAMHDRQRVLWLGGNHLSMLPVYDRLGEFAPRERPLVIQFDGHLDIYQLHDVATNPAPGNFLLHARDQLPDIINLGHRDLFLPSREIEGHFIEAYSAEKMMSDPGRVLMTLRKRMERAKQIWIDIDTDLFDPSDAPAVQTPLPFGPDPLVVLRYFSEIFASKKVCGVSITEFEPGRDQHDQTLRLLGWLIEWILLKWYE